MDRKPHLGAEALAGALAAVAVALLRTKIADVRGERDDDQADSRGSPDEWWRAPLQFLALRVVFRTVFEVTRLGARRLA